MKEMMLGNEVSLPTQKQEVQKVLDAVKDCGSMLRDKMNDPKFTNAIASVLKDKMADFAVYALNIWWQKLQQYLGRDSENSDKSFSGISNKDSKMASAEAGNTSPEEREKQGANLAFITKNCREITEVKNDWTKSRLIADTLGRIDTLMRSGADISASYMMMPNDSGLFKKLGIDPKNPDFQKNTLNYKDWNSIGISHAFLKDALQGLQRWQQLSQWWKKEKVSESTEINGIWEKVIAEGERLKSDILDIRRKASLLNVGRAVDAGTVKVEDYLRTNLKDLQMLGDNASALDPALRRDLTKQIGELYQGLRTASSHIAIPKESQKKAAYLIPQVEQIGRSFV